MDWFLYDNGLRHERVKINPRSHDILDKVPRKGPRKICGRQPLKSFTWSILEYFFPFVQAENRAHILLFFNRMTKQFIIIISYCIITMIFIITIILLCSVLLLTNITHVFHYFNLFPYFSASSLPGHKTSFNPLDKTY